MEIGEKRYSLNSHRLLQREPIAPNRDEPCYEWTLTAIHKPKDEVELLFEQLGLDYLGGAWGSIEQLFHDSSPHTLGLVLKKSADAFGINKAHYAFDAIRDVLSSGDAAKYVRSKFPDWPEKVRSWVPVAKPKS